jgi:hypothetical protein
MPITSNTELLATKQALVASVVQRELNFSAKLLNTTTDVSVYAKKGAKSVDFPKSGGFTVQNRAPGAAGVTQNLLYAVDKLDLDFRAHVQWLVEDFDAYQSNIEVYSDYISKAGTAHARNIDLQILAKLNSAAGHTEAAGIDKAKIVNCIQFLDQNHAMDEGRFMVIKPSDRAAMLLINDFVRADSMGSSNIPKGVIGEIFGVQVITHAGATSSFIYSKEAIAWAFQKGAQYGEQDANEYGVGSKLAVMDQLFGSKVVRTDGEGKELDNTTVLPAGQSPFICKIG